MSKGVFTEQLCCTRLHSRPCPSRPGLWVSGSAGLHSGPLLPPSCPHPPALPFPSPSLSIAHSWAMWSVGHPSWDVERCSSRKAKSPARKEGWGRIRHHGRLEEAGFSRGRGSSRSGRTVTGLTLRAWLDKTQAQRTG